MSQSPTEITAQPARLQIEDALYRYISIHNATLSNIAASATQLNNLMATFLNIIEQKQQQPIPAAIEQGNPIPEPFASQQANQQQSVPRQTEQQQTSDTKPKSKAN